jgi:hypothetical protein
MWVALFVGLVRRAGRSVYAGGLQEDRISRLHILVIPVAALGLVVALLAGAVAFGTPAAGAPRIACRAGQPCAYWGVMTTANPGSLGNNFFATAVISSSDAWAAG